MEADLPENVLDEAEAEEEVLDESYNKYHSEDVIKAFTQFCMDQNYSANTGKNYSSTVRRFLIWCEENIKQFKIRQVLTFQKDLPAYRRFTKDESISIHTREKGAVAYYHFCNFLRTRVMDEDDMSKTRKHEIIKDLEMAQKDASSDRARLARMAKMATVRATAKQIGSSHLKFNPDKVTEYMHKFMNSKYVQVNKTCDFFRFPSLR